MNWRQVRVAQPLTKRTSMLNMLNTMQNTERSSNNPDLPTTSMPSESSKIWSRLLTPYINNKNHFSSMVGNKSRPRINVKTYLKSENPKTKKEKAKNKNPLIKIVSSWTKSVDSVKNKLRIDISTCSTGFPIKSRIKKRTRRCWRTKGELILNILIGA